jgi:hypothetical protein
MTLAELLAARATAGADYAAAVTALRAAIVELAAIDRALESGNSGLSGALRPVQTFNELGDTGGWARLLRHPVYAAAGITPMVEAVVARADELGAALE